MFPYFFVPYGINVLNASEELKLKNFMKMIWAQLFRVTYE